MRLGKNNLYKGLYKCIKGCQRVIYEENQILNLFKLKGVAVDYRGGLWMDPGPDLDLDGIKWKF